MASRALALASLLVVLASNACKVPEANAPAGTAAPPVTSVAPSSSATPSAVAPSAVPGSPPASVAPAGSAEPGPKAAPGQPPSAETGPHGPPLPELRVKSFGLHLGGAAKDEELRRAVQRTLERGFPRYLDCYRLVEEPGVEGTFGADLHVPGDGGNAKVTQPRTKLRGEAFRACMTRALETTRFDAPASGRALVVSYSVKFSFGW